MILSSSPSSSSSLDNSADPPPSNDTTNYGPDHNVHFAIGDDPQDDISNGDGDDEQPGLLLYDNEQGEDEGDDEKGSKHKEHFDHRDAGRQKQGSVVQFAEVPKTSIGPVNNDVVAGAVLPKPDLLRRRSAPAATASHRRLDGSQRHLFSSLYHDPQSQQQQQHRPSLVRADQATYFDLSTGIRANRRQSAVVVTAATGEERSAAVTSSERGKQRYRIRSERSEAVAAAKRLRACRRVRHSASVMVSDYLRWTFRASFWDVTIVSFLAFLVFILIFAIMIWRYGASYPACIVTGSSTYDQTGTDFMDAFQLSWTTLSTVGYGIIAPAIYIVEPDGRVRMCLGINALMAVESFLGVLFAGITGAIIFGKVARIQSIAQIRFSHPICIRYGAGVSATHGEDSPRGEQEQSDDEEAIEADSEIMCPVLEFRLVNELWNNKGGEIMDASVNVVASTLDKAEGTARGVDDSFHAGATKRKRQLSGLSGITHAISAANYMSNHKGHKNGNPNGTTSNLSSQNVSQRTVTSTTSNTIPASNNTNHGNLLLMGTHKINRNATNILQKIHHQLTAHTSTPGANVTASDRADVEPYNEKQLEKELEKHFERRLAEKLQRQRNFRVQTSVIVDEGNNKLAPRQVFHKLDIETDSHPFFKRVWTIRHVLNASSPLLSVKARKMIEANNGNWPPILNHYNEVRKHLKFHEIIVNFSGTANVSGSSVFGQKIYDFCDVNIGYTFARMLTISGDGKLVVDMDLLNDVREQLGGGAEPLRGIVGNNNNIMSDPTAMMMDQATRFATDVAETGRDAIDTVYQVSNQTYDAAKNNTKGTVAGVVSNSRDGLHGLVSIHDNNKKTNHNRSQQGKRSVYDDDDDDENNSDDQRGFELHPKDSPV